MKKVLYITHLVVALFAMTSCEDFLNITPEGQAKRDEILETPEGIEEAMKAGTLGGMPFLMSQPRGMIHHKL